MIYDSSIGFLLNFRSWHKSKKLNYIIIPNCLKPHAYQVLYMPNNGE